ncbi:uncharacterized protein EV420DRAFT_1634538 [Desarmillaria tabescens]|uniref:F-box domain-containing protein n=1 Tax=Armillaria tabescens TaxID=1929756 RepID=A0AA39TYK6_ARMTA|nr:uncharacterized protein EV420DRAFT_1634538 [Desarmillaria tabescens]KAK0470113.1 hypothetical protein EV420DRAFT_1634538 [Desarmillaria tabescens]
MGSSTFECDCIPLSNLESLKRSNNAPLPAQADAIRGMIAQHKQDLGTLDLQVENMKGYKQYLLEQVTRVDGLIEEFHQQREKTCSAIQEEQMVLSPVRRLPAEVLSEIFFQTVEFPIKRTLTREESPHWSFHPAESTLMSVELVSKHWRRTVLSFPKLWSYVNILITEQSFKDDSHGIIRRVAQQLNRSKLYSLSLCISCSKETSSKFTHFPLALTTILLMVGSRTKELHLFVSSSMLSHFASLKLSFPLLDKLALLISDVPLPRLSQKRPWLLSNAPKLKKFEVIDVTFPSYLFRLPFHQIRHFKSEHIVTSTVSRGPAPFVSDLLDFLGAATDLETCVAELETGNSDASLVQSRVHVYPILCCRLNSLNLSSSFSKDHATKNAMKQFFNGLILPAVSSIKATCLVGHQEREEAVVFTSLRGLLERSKPPLTILHFTHGHILPDDLLHVLRITSTLEDLRLLDVGPGTITGEILDDLNASKENYTAPRLRTLHLSGELDFSTGSFVEMVESRWTLAENRLQRIDLCLFSANAEPNVEEATRLESLSVLHRHRAQGMSFTCKFR